MADWVLNIYNAASSSSLWATCLPSLLNLYALTGHIVLKRAMCITSDMAGILAGCKAAYTNAVSFKRERTLGYLSCWKCLGQISKKEGLGGWKMGPTVLTKRSTFAPQMMPGLILEPISLSKTLISTVCPTHISVTESSISSLKTSTKSWFASAVMAETEWNETLPWCGIKHHIPVTRTDERLPIQVASEIFFPSSLLSIQ